jgi:hypothetical protein
MKIKNIVGIVLGIYLGMILIFSGSRATDSIDNSSSRISNETTIVTNYEQVEEVSITETEMEITKMFFENVETETEIETKMETEVVIIIETEVEETTPQSSPSTFISEENTDRPVIPDCPLSEELQQHIYSTSLSYNVPYTLVMAVIKAESSFKEDAGTYCQGLMQINKNYNQEYNLWDPYVNTQRGIEILSGLLSKYSIEQSLVYYNHGEYSGKIAPTEYSSKVMRYYGEYNS